MSYQEVYQESINHPENFWKEAGQSIQWCMPYEKVFDNSSRTFYRWFTKGQLNTCYNAVDYHVENGRAEQTAIIYDSPVTHTVTKFSYRERLDYVSRFAGVLTSYGVHRGDTVILYVPMIPEAVVAMLACARIGAIHSVLFGGFAPHELAIRIDDAQPKLVISASCGIEGNKVIEYKPLLDKAIDLAKHKPQTCIIYQRRQATASLMPGRDVDWGAAMQRSQLVGCVPVESTDPLYILYTSGTTGIPKGAVRDNGGHAVALKWSMKNIYGVEPGDVFWAASDVGWVVGHSYIVYAPPGTLLTLWKNDHRFKESYLDVFPGYYFTGDGGYYDKDGYLYIMGRVDDVINVAGHRLSTGAMEEVISMHPDVAECAVIGVADSFKGQLPLGFVVMKAGMNRDPNKIVKELIQMVRDQIGAVASFRQALIVKRLPKTRSGKILRGVMRKISGGESYKIPSTIDDPIILEEIRESLRTLGYATVTRPAPGG